MTSPLSLTVALDDRSYPIRIGRRLLAEAGQMIRPLLPLSSVIIITDANVAARHLAVLEQSLKTADIRYHSIILPAGEATKSFAALEGLLEDILAQKPERKTTLIALGGGVIGDLTGFTASIMLRGVPFIQIPTTLLSQVDSSVGGKTGINSRHGKNLIGSFYQPKLVLADMDVLDTLDQREFLSGYAEVVKYGLINNPTFFEWLDARVAPIQAREKEVVQHCVLESCKAKADIVAQDEREGGVRALLNLGHTFGHALEAETGYSDRLYHGEAVAIGMMLAFQFSAQLGLCPPQDVARVEAHLRAVGLPISPHDIQPEWDIARLIGHMYQDKKMEQGKLVFILTRGIGKAFVAKDVEEKEVRKLLEKVL